VRKAKGYQRQEGNAHKDTCQYTNQYTHKPLHTTTMRGAPHRCKTAAPTLEILPIAKLYMRTVCTARLYYFKGSPHLAAGAAEGWTLEARGQGQVWGGWKELAAGHLAQEQGQGQLWL